MPTPPGGGRRAPRPRKSARSDRKRARPGILLAARPGLLHYLWVWPAHSLRHFGEVIAAGTSPLYERVAVALSESDQALHAIEAAPARKRHPTVILAARHDLALAGRAPALAAAYAAAR